MNTIFKMAQDLRSRKISVPELLKSHIDNISKNEQFNAFISIAECDGSHYAMKQANEVQRIFDKKEDLPLLAGIPYSAKDNICTKDFKTTAASKMLKDYEPRYNADAITSLDHKGAILIGKTNLDEFAMGSTCENSSFGPAKNPYCLEKSPGGSSGGSAVAVAAGLTPFSLGSDTGGSIRVPASFCGVVGYKPSYGAVSRNGLIPLASSMDQIGVLAKSVDEVEVVANTIIAPSVYDSTTNSATSIERLTTINNCVDLSFFDNCKIRVGVLSNFENMISTALNKMLSSSIEIERFDFGLNDYEQLLAAYYVISSAEASSNLARYDGVRYGYRTENASTLDKIFINSRSESFGQEVKRRIALGTYFLSKDDSDNLYKKALAFKKYLVRKCDEIFCRFDVIVSATTPKTAPFLTKKNANVINSIDNNQVNKKTNREANREVAERRNPVEIYHNDINTVLANLTGNPAISIPCGFDEAGMPIGIQFICPKYQDEKLFQIAKYFETELNFRSGNAIGGGMYE